MESYLILMNIIKSMIWIHDPGWENQNSIKISMSFRSEISLVVTWTNSSEDRESSHLSL